MTIVECLMAMFVAGLVIAMAALGTQMVRKEYEASRRAYDAEIWAEELAEELTETLRFAIHPIVEEDAVCYIDPVSEKKQTITLENRSRPYGKGKNDILSVCRLKEEQPIFSWDVNGRCIGISFGICDESGKILAKMQERRVWILNP